MKFPALITTAAAALTLTACEAPMVSEDGFTRLSTEAALAPIYDRDLMIGDNYAVLGADGSLGGRFGGVPLVGEWELKDGYVCRVITSGSERVMQGAAEDCQLFEAKGDEIRVTRDRGNGVSFTYTVQ